MERYDYIFCGGGCAGLSLLYYLLESKWKEANILIIDPAHNEEVNKTWCYWATEPLQIHPKESIISWNTYSLKSGQKKLRKSFKNLNYYHLNSSNFYESIYTKAKTRSNVEFLKDRVIELKEESDYVTIKTEKTGLFIGNLVFDSRISSSHDGNSKLKQLFVGWKIKTQLEAFEPKKMTLMDFRTESSIPFDFFYILPFSEKEALIEYTAYSKNLISYDSLESHLKKYLKKKFEENPFEITYVEKGTIPMSTKQTSYSESDKIIPIGTKAGWTKPSTGYTFYQIQTNCQFIVKRLEENKIDKLIINRKPRFKFYDNVLLNIAHRWPEKLKYVFLNMFGSSSSDLIFRFLSEETTFWEELKILSRLKFSIFLKSLFHYESH
ncbi:lycopene cyclase family protein [Algoriphagus aquatilis]|uniref:Lycopene cyclase family protein n=1 Tax=Algoriphagus aquatilis TaxID=490186 RepID=A0ABW0BTM8_9BACT